MGTRKYLKLFLPLDKVILFNGDAPRIGYVCNKRVVELQTDGIDYVFVTMHIDDAKEGKGGLIRKNKIAPYTDVLWRACERWMTRVKDTRKMFDALSDGTIPKELADYEQPSLL